MSNWLNFVIRTSAFALPSIPAGQEHILEQEDGKKRWVQVVTELSRALMSAPRSPFGLPVGSLSRSARLALCAASDEATEIRDDVSLLTHPPPLGGFALRAACGSLPQPALRENVGLSPLRCGCLASRQSAWLQALQAALNKQSSQNRKTPEQIDAAIRQLVSKAITTEGQVIDVFTAAGLPKPDI